jgi:DNA-binding transcriptional LysR family regulator
MELRQIEYLLAVVDEGSFTAASERLTVAQSAISHQVAKLERELELVLLIRGRPAVTPTPAGEVFIGRMRRVVAELAAARSEAQSLKGVTVGAVSFGATFPAASLNIPNILARFRTRRPGIQVSLREGTTAELLALLKHDVLDSAVVSIDAAELPSGLEGVVVDRDDLVLVGPVGHRLEVFDKVPIRELDGEDQVGFRRGAGLRAAADDVLTAHGIVPRVTIESNEMPVLVGLVANGLGVAILPQRFVSEPTPGVFSRPIVPPINPPLSLVWRNGRQYPPAAEDFLRFIAAEAPPA